MPLQPTYVDLSHPELGTVTVQSGQVAGLEKAGWSRVDGTETVDQPADDADVYGD